MPFHQIPAYTFFDWRVRGAGPPYISKSGSEVAHFVLALPAAMDFNLRAATKEDCRDISRMIMVNAFEKEFLMLFNV